jgi:hypothetical protein
MRVIISVILLLMSCSGHAPPPGPPMLCRIDTSLDATKPLVQRALPSPFWFSLLVRGYQPTGDVPRPVRDCEGRDVRWTADACAAEATRARSSPSPSPTATS